MNQPQVLPVFSTSQFSSKHLNLAVVAISALLPLRYNVAGLPVNTIAAAALGFLGLLRRPAITFPLPRLVSVGVPVLVAWLVGLSLVIGSEGSTRRIGNIVILMTFAYVIASARIHVASLIVGMGVGLTFGVVHAVLTVEQSRYPGRITGYLGDPNGAGFAILTSGLIVLGVLAGRRQGLFWVALAGIATAVILTESRTTMFAMAAACAWVYVAPRAGRLVTLVGAAVLAPTYTYLIGWAKSEGYFVDRSGSDELRARLVEAEEQEIARVGWVGDGLGSARVQVDTDIFWYHNSFWALRAEGGALAYILLLAILATLAWMAFSVPRSIRNAWFEASLVAALICSINIGFSLISVTSAMAFGIYCLYWRSAMAQVDAMQPTRNVPVGV